MARQISRAEAYERAHEVFTQVNFNSFDYASIKESLINYIKLYYPEDFNDYIESSEFIALLELFAYIAELMAYRIDINAHENFITTAQRKESVLRLAKLISYNASRNVPARGLVKISSIQSSEAIIDSQGRNLAGRQIIWGDSNNPDWKEQFLLIMNKVLEQEFGTVNPNERIQLDDVLFELYSWNNSPLNSDGRTLFSYSASISGQTFPMELVPVALEKNGPLEKRPERNTSFSILFASDGLGDTSDTTGFMLFTKQGQLRLQEESYDGITPNQITELLQTDINETDIFVNQVSSDTREILISDPNNQNLPHVVADELRFGEWVGVDLANAQNIIFNTNAGRHKYEVETLDNDGARLVFGGGEFSDIPAGLFDIWYRTSANTSVSIPRTSVIDQQASFTYVDHSKISQTLTFKFSLISALQNSSASETIAHVKKVAPAVYYTQDRMVNGRDYNTFMLQDPTILKLRSVNRTFAGDSKYIAWHDPKEYYENVKLFGDDAAVYWNELDPNLGALAVIATPESSEAILNNYLEPLLCSSDFFSVLAPIFQANNKLPSSIRCTFNDSKIPYSFNPSSNETTAITAALNVAVTTTPIIDLYYSVKYDEWTVEIHPTVDAESIWMIRTEARFAGANLSGWDVRWRTRRLICNSQSTKFYNPNVTGNIIDFDTLNSLLDKVVVLQANSSAQVTGLLADNLNYTVVGQELVEQNLPNAGLPDDNSLSIMPSDVDADGIPDNLAQDELFDGSFEFTGLTGTPTITLPHNKSYVVSYEAQDILVELDVGGIGAFTPLVFGTDWDLSAAEIGEIIRRELTLIQTVNAADIIRITIKDYVYFTRGLVTDPWVPQEGNDANILSWALDTSAILDNRRNKRHEGRFPLNFAWMHITPRFHLIDPAASNIIDIFIITRGYHSDLVRYLENRTDNKPDIPSSLSLRTTYAKLLNNKMISDTVILHPGKFKILFGNKASPELRATFKIVRPELTNLTDNEVKVRVVNAVRAFMAVEDWEFGETFYFTELAASIHSLLSTEIDSIVIVPVYNQNQFGDLFQIQSREDEILIADISTSDVQIVQTYTPDNIRQEN